MNRRNFLLGASALVSLSAAPARAAGPGIDIQVFKSPRCGCCGAWVSHLRSAGFSVTVAEVHSAAAERKRLGMPDRYSSCHTATVGGYVLEGHVPAADVKRLLTAKPNALGLAVPGMPPSAPGMDVPGRQVPYQVLLVDRAGDSSVFASYESR